MFKFVPNGQLQFPINFLALTAMTKRQAPPDHPVPLQHKFRNKTNKLNTVLNNFKLIDDKLLNHFKNTNQ